MTDTIVKAWNVYYQENITVKDALDAITGGGLSTTDTYATLKALDTVGTTQVLVNGRSAVNDGGEGIFIFDGSNLSTQVTADTLEAFYVAPTADPTGATGAWVRQYTGAKKASWAGIGAAGDNSATLNTLFSEMSAGDVWIFDRDFELAATTLMQSKSDITIIGDGVTITETTTDLNGTIGFQLCDNVTISGFSFVGAETEAAFSYATTIGPSYPAVLFDECDFCTAKEIRSESGKSGLVHITGGTSNTCKIVDCYHVGLWASVALSYADITTGGKQINGVSSYYISDGTGSWITGCYARGTGSGILVGGSAEDVKILNNEIITCYDNCIYLSSATRAIVTGNKTVNAPHGAGLKLRDVGGSIVNNNTANDCNIGITLSGANGLSPDAYGAIGAMTTVDGNSIFDCAIGINVDYIYDEPTEGVDTEPRDVIISNNYFRECGNYNSVPAINSSQSPIRIRAGDGMVVTGNIVDQKGHPDASYAIYIDPNFLNHGLTITNNSIRGDWSSGIYAVNITSSVISENVAQDTDVIANFIYLSNVTDSVISNNISMIGTRVIYSYTGVNDNIISNNIGNGIYIHTRAANRFLNNIPETSNYITSVAATPSYLGEVALSGGNYYMAVGTSSSADWKQIT